MTPSGSPPTKPEAEGRATSPLAPAALPPRFLSCVHALYVAPEGEAEGARALADVRRCPVGVIAAVDCPEFAGLSCRCHEDRGERPPSVVPRGETTQMSAELADDYLTEGYVRRLRPLRRETPPPRGAELLAAAPPPGDAPASAPLRRAVGPAVGVPINVPADRVRRPAARGRAADAAGHRS